jgi:hypothetical protein
MAFLYQVRQVMIPFTFNSTSNSDVNTPTVPDVLKVCTAYISASMTLTDLMMHYRLFVVREAFLHHLDIHKFASDKLPWYPEGLTPEMAAWLLITGTQDKVLCFCWDQDSS